MKNVFHTIRRRYCETEKENWDGGKSDWLHIFPNVFAVSHLLARSHGDPTNGRDESTSAIAIGSPISFTFSGSMAHLFDRITQKNLET